MWVLDTHFASLSCRELPSHLNSHSLPFTTIATTTPLSPPSPLSPPPLKHLLPRLLVPSFGFISANHESSSASTWGLQLGWLRLCSILFTPPTSLSFAVPFLRGASGVCCSPWLKAEQDRMALFCAANVGCSFTVDHSGCCCGGREPRWRHPLLDYTVAPPLKMAKITEGESQGGLA